MIHLITISLCMIVKNEEETLPRCLESVRAAVDEIIIVDTGSTDRTKEAASRYASKIIDYAWHDDFAAARNFSFSFATQEYILWLDADDFLLPDDRDKLLHLKQTLDPSIDIVSMGYHCAFDEYGNVSLKVRRVRLVKRSQNYLWFGAAHEDLLVHGNHVDSDIVVTHGKVNPASGRNLRILEKQLAQGKPLSKRETLHYAMELHQHRMYDKAIEAYATYMNSNRLSAEETIFVLIRLADCHHHLGDQDKELHTVFKAMEYGLPRPELCCRLGYYFLQKKQYRQAVYWYTLATQVPEPDNPWAIANEISRTWLPHMQLGLCYYELGEYELSYRHNQIALGYRRDDRAIANNLALLQDLIARKYGGENG